VATHCNSQRVRVGLCGLEEQHAGVTGLTNSREVATAIASLVSIKTVTLNAQVRVRTQNEDGVYNRYNQVQFICTYPCQSTPIPL
jgi:hypothetical protein